ncbi:MAG: hypothetical protein B7Z14_09755 [Bosea sp. 32-68-6]|nr:MAG: hypothetical protein B7Z14_09755 [Bosea sp. 32-68-6]
MTKALEKSVGRALLVTARLHRARMGERLNALGLFPGQEQALKALQPAPMTMGELASLLRVKPPTVSKTIGRWTQVEEELLDRLDGKERKQLRRLLRKAAKGLSKAGVDVDDAEADGDEADSDA